MKADIMLNEAAFPPCLAYKFLYMASECVFCMLYF